MSPVNHNAAIALASGWHYAYSEAKGEMRWYAPDGHNWSQVPDFFNDATAIAEAENFLSTEEQARLKRSAATPGERATAFLRCKGLLTLCAILLSIPSCVVMQETKADGSKATYASLGGKGAYRIGEGVVHSHEKSLKHVTSAVSAVAATVAAADSLRATEATNQVRAVQATKQHAATTSAQTTQVLSGHQLEATKAAIGSGAEVLPVSIKAP